MRCFSSRDTITSRTAPEVVHNDESIVSTRTVHARRIRHLPISINNVTKSICFEQGKASVEAT